MNKEFAVTTPSGTTVHVNQSSAHPSRPEPGHSFKLKLLPINPLPEVTDSTVSIQHPELNISRHLKAPKLSHVKPNTVTYEQAHAGVNVNIPGSDKMRLGDTLMFYWGQNKSSTRIHLRTITKDSTVRVLCISYELIAHLQYGLVDVYYEVHRDQYLIGTSPAVRVTVNREPAPPRKKQQTGSGPCSPTDAT
jgi:hypothetical protein